MATRPLANDLERPVNRRILWQLRFGENARKKLWFP